MANARFAAADYQSALQSLLPKGLAWPRQPDSTQSKVMAGLSQIYARSDASANQLIEDAFPLTANAMLPEWESSLGLPSACSGGVAPTIQGRRAAIVSRLAAVGGQSAAYFIQYAANLGYTITVTMFSPFRAGASRCGSPLGGTDWSHTWAVNAPLNTVTSFRCGQSAAGEPLAAWGNLSLVCELSLIKPAHTILQFRYS